MPLSPSSRLFCLTGGATQPLSPSRDFKDGRWLNNTLTVKDEWVEKYYDTVVNYRLGIEGDKTLQKQGAVLLVCLFSCVQVFVVEVDW